MLKAKAENNELKYDFLLKLSTAYFATHISLDGFLALMPFLREEFSLSGAQAGLYSTFYFFTATIVAIFSGRVVDMIGSKKGVVFGAGSIGILMFFHASAPNFKIILLLALFTGLSFSIITPSLNKAIMKKVKPQNRALSMGLMQSGGGVGGVLGASLLPLLGGVIGWRIAVLLSGFTALLISIFIFKFYHEDSVYEKAEEKNKETSFFKNIGVLFKNKYLMLVCLLGLGFGTSIGAIPAHFTLYLTQDLSISKSLAGVGLGILHTGGIVGRPAWGWISDRFLGGSRRKGLIIVGAFFVIISSVFAFYITKFASSVIVIYVFSFLLGLTGFGWMGIYFTTVAELASAKYTGIATGLALIFTRSGVVISPPVFGYLADINQSYWLSWLAISILILIFTVGFSYISGKFFTEDKQI